MRIGIDCRLSGKRHGGIGRYIQELITHLSDQSDHRWVLFFFDQKQVSECFPNQVPSSVEIHITPIKHYTFHEQLAFVLDLYKAKLDLLHVPHFNTPVLYFKPLVITIHDLLWHHKRGAHVTTLSPLVYWIKYFFYLLVTSWSIIRAKKILVPSQTIKDTVHSYYPFADKKVTAIYEGVSHKPENTPPISLELKTLLKEKSPYFLYVGSLYPHKNVELIIKALPQLSKFNLIIAGSRSAFQKDLEETIKKHNVSKRVFFTGYVTDDDLQHLYSNAEALVQPSFSEGFGLTGVEALQLGVPLLASNIPIFKEIYQDTAIYFEPHSLESFLAATKSVSHLDLKEFRHRAKAITSQYNWHEMAKKTLEVYNETLSS